MLIIILCLVGCEQIKDENGVYRDSEFGFIEIKRIHNANRLIYDPETKVVYILIRSGYIAGISPYYIIGKDEKPEVAVYGVNYNIENR